MLPTATLPDPLDALHATFGFSAFRGVQAEVVDRVLAGRSTLAVMPTGAGKSLTYQLPAVMLPGTCVVISPLIALMHDQLRSATANGIRAATLTAPTPTARRRSNASAPARSTCSMSRPNALRRGISASCCGRPRATLRCS